MHQLDRMEAMLEKLTGSEMSVRSEPEIAMHVRTMFLHIVNSRKIDAIKEYEHHLTAHELGVGNYR